MLCAEFPYLKSKGLCMRVKYLIMGVADDVATHLHAVLKGYIRNPVDWAVVFPVENSGIPAHNTLDSVTS